MSSPEPNAPACPNCGAAIKLVRTIAHLRDLPEIHIYYCATCQRVETTKLKRAA